MTYAAAIQSSKDQVRPAHPTGLVGTTLAASRRVSKLPTLGGSQGPRPVAKLPQAFGKITVDTGGNDGKQVRTIWITHEAITFGKSLDADIRIVGLHVANWHCHLKFDDPNVAFLKKDEGPETYVNGQLIFGTEEERLNGFRLSDGDSIRIGARKFKFEYCKERKHSNSIIAAMSRNDQNLASTIGNTPLRQENKISVVKGTPIHPVDKSAVSAAVTAAPRQGLSLRNATEEPQAETKSGLFATQMDSLGDKRRKSTTTAISQKSSHELLLSKSRKTVAVPEAAVIAAKANTNDSQGRMECRKLLEEAMAKANQAGVFGAASIPPPTSIAPSNQNSLPSLNKDPIENKMEIESTDNKENSRVPLPDQSTVFAAATATAEPVAADPVSAPIQSMAPVSDQQPQMKAKPAYDKTQRIKRLSLYPASAVGMPSKSNRELRKTIGFKGDDRVAIPFLSNAQQMNSSPVHSTRIEVEVIHSKSVNAENAAEKPKDMINQDSSMVDDLSTGRVSTPVNMAPPGTPVAASSKGSQPKSAKISKEGQLFHFYKNLPPATPVHVSKERILSPGSGSSVGTLSEAASSPAGSFVERLELVAKEEMNHSPTVDSKVSLNSTPSSVAGDKEIDLESYASSPRTLEDPSSPVPSVKSTPKNTPIPSPGSLMKRVSDAFKASPAAAFLSRPLSYLGTPVNVPTEAIVAPTSETKEAPAKIENVEKAITTEVAENMVRSPVAALHDRSYEDVQELVEEMGQVSLECPESSSDAMKVAESAPEVANEEGPKRVFKRVHIIFDDEGSETVEYIEETIESGHYDEIDEEYDENDDGEYEEYFDEENVADVEVPEETTTQETNQVEKESVPQLRKFDARIAQSVQREHLIFDDSPGGRQHWLLAEEDPNQTFVIPNDDEEEEDAVSEPSVRDVFDLLAHCDDTDAEVETFGTPMSIGSNDGNLFVVQDAHSNKVRNPDLLAAMKAGFAIRPMDTPERRDLGKSDPVGFLVRPRAQHQTTPVAKRKIHTPWVVEGDSDSEDAEVPDHQGINHDNEIETTMDDVSANVTVQHAVALEEEMAKLEITSSPLTVDSTDVEVVMETVASQSLYPTLSTEVVNEPAATDSVNDANEVHASSEESMIQLAPVGEVDEIKVDAPNETPVAMEIEIEAIPNESPSTDKVSVNDMESSAISQEELSSVSQDGPAVAIQSSEVMESCPPQLDIPPIQESPSMKENNELIQDVHVVIDDSVAEESEEPIDAVTEPEPEIQNDVVEQTEIISSKSEEQQPQEQNVTEESNADANMEEEATVRRSARIRSKQTATAVTPARPAVQTPNPRGGRSRSRARLAPPEDEVIPESEPVLTESTESNIPEPALVPEKQPEEAPKKSVGRGRGRKAASVEVEEEPESKDNQESSEDDKENQEEDIQEDSNATRTPYNLRRRAPVTPAANTVGKNEMVTTGGRTTRSRAARAVTPVAGTEQDDEEPTEFEEGKRTRGRKATARR